MVPPEMIEKLVDRFSSPQNTQSAPLMLREEMAFPYLYGLEFVHQILLKGGREQAYSGIFKRPPESTRQIMEPATYLSHEKLAPLPMPALEDVFGKQYEKVESGSIGEFDSMVLMKQFGTLEQAKSLPAGWRGDYFYAARPTRPDADGSGTSTGATNAGIKPEDIALLYVSRWATPLAAHAFASFYCAAVAKRYTDAKPAGTAPHASPADVEEWNTTEGKVTARVHGNLVVVLESFDPETASRINSAVLKTDK